MPRLFAALELPSSIVESLSVARGSVEGAYWQQDQQLHLTLGFFGNVGKRATEDLIDQLAGLYVRPFLLQLAGVGQFGKDGRVKALWAGVADAAPIQHLHEKVCQAARQVGVAVDERRFKPHVTLARFSRGSYPNIGPWLHDNENLISPAEMVQHFTLFSSHQTDEGHHYRAEASFGTPLRPRGLSDHRDPSIPPHMIDHQADDMLDDLEAELAAWESHISHTRF